MKKKAIFSIGLLLISLIIGYKVYSDIEKIIKQPFIFSEDKFGVTVKSGDTLNNVINTLYREDKIGNAYLIKWYIKTQKLNTNIKPGIYSVDKNTTLPEFLDNLGKGKYNENAVKVTIPEGYEVEKIALLLDEKQIISKEDFLKSCKEYSLPSYIKKDTNRKYALEGYLFPDTYEFIKGMKGKEIIDIMIKNYEAVLKNIESMTGKQYDISELDKLMTMASVVEREAELASERPIVASVFFNRININMKLQSCATVEYALGVHKTVYTEKDLKVKSPYNTYLVSGLPVGPICNPGKDSILAAAKPAQTNYLFFVSKFDGTKTHFFSKDYAEFLKNKKISEANMAKLN